MSLLHEETTELVLKAFYEVYNTLGYGFLEKYYEKAMIVELHALGLSVAQQVPAQIFYKGQWLGDQAPDLVVDGKIVVEIKAMESLTNAHDAQLLNYIRATGMHVGLFLNFGKKPEFRRKIRCNTVR